MKKAMALLCSILCFTSRAAVDPGRGAGSTRTVTGAFTTTYWPDDGTTTTVSTPPPYHLTLRALFVSDGSQSGYRVFPIELRPDYSFAVADVPVGSYFLQFDQTFRIGDVTVNRMQLSEMAADAPDLSVISAARPDLARVTQQTDVTLDVSNLQPWQYGDLFLISSSQADVYTRPTSGLRPPPVPGMTSYTGVFDWRCCSTAETPGLPDASRGDVVFINQRSSLPIGQGDTAAVLRYASRYARVTDFTVIDGQPATLAASLVETPQTGRIRADVRGTQFAALAPDVHPTAQPQQNNLGFSVLVSPHAVEFPDRPPAGAGSSVFYFQSLTNTSTDADYGTLAYPQFHDPMWKEFRQILHGFDVTLRRPDSKETIRYSVQGASHVSMSPPPEDPIAPLLSPPTAPLINGVDAFQPQMGVGLQPIISWSAPRLGEPTSYGVDISSASQPREGETVGVSVTVHGKTSFTVPPGVLQPGNLYVATITAFQAPWDTLNRAPFRQGAPFQQISCVTDLFIP